MAPFIRLAEDDSGNRGVGDGAFGLLSVFAKEVAYGRRTYNAKSETVASSPASAAPGPALHRARRSHLRALLRPPESKPVRWRIQQPGEVPFGIAGIWEEWLDTESGTEMSSFAVLTVNADDHPVMSRFQKWGEEKRRPIFLDPHEYDD